LDGYCAGDYSDGLSWETAHVIKDIEVDFNSGCTWPWDGPGFIHLESISRYLYIINCSIRYTDYQGISMQSCRNIKIINSTFYLGQLNGFDINQCSDISIINCDIGSCPKNGIRVSSSTNITISENLIWSNWNQGIYFKDVKGSLIQYNTISNHRSPATNSMAGLVLFQSDQNEIHSNIFSNNYNSISVLSSDENLIFNNSIDRNALNYDVFIDPTCEGNYIFENNFLGTIEDQGIDTHFESPVAFQGTGEGNLEDSDPNLLRNPKIEILLGMAFLILVLILGGLTYALYRPQRIP
jgi:parallel beta-helix repeat protein